MLEIYGISVPTPYLAGPTNAYLIKNQPYTLVDPGPETEDAKKSLLEGLASFGVELKDISRVIITHSHTDHSGLASWIGEQAGAEIYVHNMEVRKLQREYIYYHERLPFFQEAGVPESVLNDIFADKDPVVKPVLPESGVVVLHGGEELAFAGGTVRVLHLPGHTSGHICLYDPDSNNFLAGDFILKHITPNPVMEANPDDFSKRSPALRQYLESLEKAEMMKIGLILPGHGKTINNSKETMANAQMHHARRLEAFLAILSDRSLNAFQLMREFYPKIRGFQIYLGISEIFAHLDYLVEVGRVVREERGGVSIYHKANLSLNRG
jgi:glyoxylase-like metal-dependent hydrolase (beta-lactamase superfamily II)